MLINMLPFLLIDFIELESKLRIILSIKSVLQAMTFSSSSVSNITSVRLPFAYWTIDYT